MIRAEKKSFDGVGECPPSANRGGGDDITTPHTKSDTKPTLSNLNQNSQDGDSAIKTSQNQTLSNNEQKLLDELGIREFFGSDSSGRGWFERSWFPIIIRNYGSDKPRKQAMEEIIRLCKLNPLDDSKRDYTEDMLIHG